MTFNEYPEPEYIKDFSNPMTQWQQECQKKNRFNKQDNNFAYASHFFVHFFAALSLLWHKNAQFCILWRTCIN